MTPEIESAIVKYLSNSASIDELNILSVWIENDSNKEIFKEFVYTHFAINYSLNDSETRLATYQLLPKISKEK
jgi:transmembrane sensor